MGVVLLLTRGVILSLRGVLHDLRGSSITQGSTGGHCAATDSRGNSIAQGSTA